MQSPTITLQVFRRSQPCCENEEYRNGPRRTEVKTILSTTTVLLESQTKTVFDGWERRETCNVIVGLWLATLLISYMTEEDLKKRSKRFSMNKIFWKLD